MNNPFFHSSKKNSVLTHQLPLKKKTRCQHLISEGIVKGNCIDHIPRWFLDPTEDPVLLLS